MLLLNATMPSTLLEKGVLLEEARGEGRSGRGRYKTISRMNKMNAFCCISDTIRCRLNINDGGVSVTHITGR